ncbi:MAG: hypothetical protein BWY59_00669 [Verrucomicrobia bacterium ADurb.Bin345]|nr:MAG: hypothetical protein BWY59_00669 [Verrucomicrobia bacterium ADurb.Bin345]
MEEVLGRQLQGGRRAIRIRAVLPENGRTALGRNDGVIGEFENQDAVADADSESAAAAALADDRHDHRDGKREHLVNVVRDGLRDMPLLGDDAREGAGRVDERDDGRAEFRRQLHQPQRLAVALRIRASEIAFEVAFRVSALLGADEHDRLAAHAGEAADDRAVVGKAAVAVQFHEVRRDGADVIERIGAERMPRHLHALPGGQVLVDIPSRFIDLLLHPVHLERDVNVLRLAEVLQLLEFLLQFDDRLLKRQCIRRHGESPPSLLNP